MTTQKGMSSDASQPHVRTRLERWRDRTRRDGLAAIVDSADVAIVGLTPHLVISRWSSGAERLSGYASAEVVGRPIEVLVPSEDVHANLFHRVVRGERVAGADAHVLTKTGTVLPVSLTLSPVVGPRGEMFGVALVAQDATERRHAEAMLRASEERFRSLVQSSSDLMMVCDARGMLTYVSPASKRMLGIEETELTGQPVARLIRRSDWEALGMRLVRLSRGQDAGGIFPCQVRHADGSSIRAEVTLSRLLEDPPSGSIILNLRDVTDRHRLELELRHAQKLESVGQLAAGIAHEINTPIQFVGDNVEFLRGAFTDLFRLMEAADDPEQAEVRRLDDADAAYLAEEVPIAIDQTLEGVQRVSAIVRAMKAFGHPSGEEKTLADVNQAVRNTLLVANNEIKYVADVMTELGDIPQVWCHPNDINQVLLNLVVNAAQAVGEAVEGTGRRGTLTVRTAQRNEGVVIQVTDTGVGIPADVADRVFEPFFTTKEVGKGTGQGLAIAYTLVRDRHNGTISFESEPGAGTTFTVWLPFGSRHRKALTNQIPA